MIAWAKNVADQDMEEKDTGIKDIMEKDIAEADIVKVGIMDAAVEDTTEDVPAVQGINALVDSTMDGEDSSRKEKRSKSSRNTRRNWKKNSRLLKSKLKI